MSQVAANVAAVRSRIEAAARRAGREPSGVQLVAATKTVPSERIREAVAAGVIDVGENRAQELVTKARELAVAPPSPRWHFLGALQRNKVRVLAEWVELWQTIDRVEVARTVAHHAPGARVLVEVNLAGEPQKAGCAPTDAGSLVDDVRGVGLRIDGLMAVPPADDDARRWFAGLRELGERLELTELSMGMTADFEVAVEEGATIVRIGQALFGARPERVDEG